MYKLKNLYLPIYDIYLLYVIHYSKYTVCFHLKTFINYNFTIFNLFQIVIDLIKIKMKVIKNFGCGKQNM